MTEDYSKYEDSFVKFKDRLTSNVLKGKSTEPMSDEYKEYIKRLKSDNVIIPIQEHIYFEIKRKLNINAIGGEFKASQNQSNLMNMLFKYFLHQDSTIDTKKGICLLGTFGSGKTEIMRAFTLTHFHEHKPYEKPCKVTSAIEMIDHYNNETNFNTYFENNIYIDDLGSEQRAKYMSKEEDPILSKFFELWYLRKGLKLYLTTNLSMQELSDKYGGRVYSRLHELCNFIELDEQTDFRL